MKAERQHKKPQQADPIQSKRESPKLSFVDNRPQAIMQTKMIDVIQRYELSSQALAGNLEYVDFGRYTPEAHHIIPVEIVNGSFEPNDREEFGIYRSYDDAWNGIYLPSCPFNTEEPESNNWKLPYHRRGQLSHGQYTNWVRGRLNWNLSSDDANDVEAVQNLASNIRDTIVGMSDDTCLDDIGANDNVEEATNESPYSGSHDFGENDFMRWNPMRKTRFQGNYFEET